MEFLDWYSNGRSIGDSILWVVLWVGGMMECLVWYSRCGYVGGIMFGCSDGMFDLVF